MEDSINSDDIQSSIHETFGRMPTGKRFKVETVSIDGQTVTVTLSALPKNTIYGAKLKIPSSTADPLWHDISPRSINEWVEYKVFWPIVEELDTGGDSRTTEVPGSDVQWLNLSD